MPFPTPAVSTPISKAVRLPAKLPFRFFAVNVSPVAGSPTASAPVRAPSVAVGCGEEGASLTEIERCGCGHRRIVGIAGQFGAAGRSAADQSQHKISGGAVLHELPHYRGAAHHEDPGQDHH